MPVRTGLDRLVAERFESVGGRRVGLVCHAASVDHRLRHVTVCMRDAGVRVARCFGPEHGIWSDAQDMIGVEEARDPITGAPVVSLYGTREASLSPSPAQLADLDLLIIDLQDIGARYYTYVYTAALCVRAAARIGLPVWLLDRPNPLGGRAIEGSLTGRDHLSFVGLWPLPTRHGLTIGEIVRLLDEREGFGANLRVVEMAGWRRSMFFDDTGLPWVQPSPNMPTLDTALVYPGLCLIEGTDLSEGRGTTRPFELIGADFIDAFQLADALNRGPLEGIHFRPVFFRPAFHKFSGQTISGVALHVDDRLRFQPLRAGMHLLATLRRLYGDALRWRSEVYEFVTDRLAIDLLFGGPEAREIIDAGGDVDRLWGRWQVEAEAFRSARQPWLLYP